MNGFWRQYTKFCCVQQSPIKCKATSPSIPGFYWGPRVLDTHEHYNKRQTGVGTNKIQKQKIFQQIHHFDFAEICFCPPQTPS